MPRVVKAVSPDVVGYVPEGLRESFSSVLPIQGLSEQLRDYGTMWYGDQFPDTERLHPDVRHFMPVIEGAMEAGGLFVSRSSLITLTIRQDDVRDTEWEGTAWHRDRNADGLMIYERKVIINDVWGTKYKNEGGGIETTPDYGMLLINDETEHKAQTPDVDAIRTRLQITEV